MLPGQLIILFRDAKSEEEYLQQGEVKEIKSWFDYGQIMRNKKWNAVFFRSLLHIRLNIFDTLRGSCNIMHFWEWNSVE